MLDLHVLSSSAGSTSLIQPATIPSNDGQVVAGVPIISDPGKALLIAWGAVAIDATKAPKQASLNSNDLNDPPNGSVWTPVGASLAISTPHLMERLLYRTAARVVKVAQKAAGAEFSFTIDHYDAGMTGTICVRGDYAPPGRGIYSQAFGGALTSLAWGTQVFTPTYNLPTGRYAILGAWVSGLTNVAAIRFQHADFKTCQPGFLVADKFTSATTVTGLSGDELLLVRDGSQFVRLSEITGQPQCPVFSAGPNGTGLTIWCMDCTADTPTVILNLAKVG